MDLTSFDRVVINTSAGKDSLAMMSIIVALARDQGVLGRVLAVHCDIGQVEWEGTRELAEEHCRHFGIPLVIVRRERGDLLAQVEARGKWPDSANRYCTSDQKRDQVAKLHTQIVGELSLGRRARILNCMGFRAEESPARAKRDTVSVDKRLSNGKREVVNWLPIHHWTVGEVWAEIAKSGARPHPAYALGMPRLSCMFCIFAPKAALMIAGRANRALLDKYCAIEAKIGHRFQDKLSLASVRDAIDRGEIIGKPASWNM